jgi:hypothetical protein
MQQVVELLESRVQAAKIHKSSRPGLTAAAKFTRLPRQE